MNLKNFDFPNVSAIDIAFSGLDTDKRLLSEATVRGFDDRDTPYNRLFSQLFFNGGKVVFKEGIDETFKIKAWAYCRALMGSFSPKHEHKEAVCAMILSELVEPNLA